MKIQHFGKPHKTYNMMAGVLGALIPLIAGLHFRWWRFCPFVLVMNWSVPRKRNLLHLELAKWTKCWHDLVTLGSSRADLVPGFSGGSMSQTGLMSHILVAFHSSFLVYRLVPGRDKLSFQHRPLPSHGANTHVHGEWYLGQFHPQRVGYCLYHTACHFVICFNSPLWFFFNKAILQNLYKPRKNILSRTYSFLSDIIPM